MEFTCLLDTSLDLTIKPLTTLSETMEQEADINFINLGRRSDSAEDEKGALIEELHRMSAENKKLTEMLTLMCESYTQLRNQLMDHKSNNNNNIATISRKRKGEIVMSINNNFCNTNVVGSSDSSTSSDIENSSKKPKEEILKDKISRVHVRTEASDTSLIVKDGYQWRKYGQKVTRDNPSPRAYFKCSFAPTCPVKKKVQRSIEDQLVVVATYEGEHNHPHPSKPDANRNSTPGNVQPCSSGPTITLDLTKPNNSVSQDTRNPMRGVTEAPEVLQQYFVEHMASTLTNDPGFKAALAAAISGKFLQQDTRSENWY